MRSSIIPFLRWVPPFPFFQPPNPRNSIVFFVPSKTFARPPTRPLGYPAFVAGSTSHLIHPVFVLQWDPPEIQLRFPRLWRLFSASSSPPFQLFPTTRSRSHWLSFLFFFFLHWTLLRPLIPTCFSPLLIVNRNAC